MSNINRINTLLKERQTMMRLSQSVVSPIENDTAPYNPPNITYAGHRNIFGYNGQIQIPDPLNAVNVNVSNNLITENLKVNSGIITLSDTAGNQTLEAIGTDLFYDGQLLAKANDIQNISDWALYPAIGDVNIDGKNIENVLKLTDSNNVFGTNGQYLTSDGSKIQWTTPVSGGVTQLNTLTGNVTVSSTNNATLSVAQVGQDIQLTVPAAAAGVASLNSQTGSVSLTSAASSISITNPSPGVINLESASGGTSTWANFPAVNNVNLPNKDLNMTTTTPGVAYNKASLNANVDIGDITNAPLRPDFNAFVGNFNIGGLTSPATSVNITSLGNVGILGGAGVSISGGGGVAVSGGGAVAVTGVGGVAVTGGGDISVTGGAINVNGLVGVSIIGGGGVAVTGGGAVAVTGGVGVTAAGGAGVAVTGGGGVAVLGGGGVAIGASGGAGGGLQVFGSDLTMAPVGASTSTLRTNNITSQTGTATLALTNVATINGIAYPPPSSAGVISERATNTTPITLTATTFGTAQTILTMTISPTVISDINANVSFYYQTNSNTNYDIIFYLTLDGVQIGATMKDTTQGANHFSNCSITGSGINQSVGLHTILLKAYAGSAPASGNLTVIASSGTVLSNLV